MNFHVIATKERFETVLFPVASDPLDPHKIGSRAQCWERENVSGKSEAAQAPPRGPEDAVPCGCRFSLGSSAGPAVPAGQACFAELVRQPQACAEVQRAGLAGAQWVAGTHSVTGLGRAHPSDTETCQGTR